MDPNSYRDAFRTAATVVATRTSSTPFAEGFYGTVKDASGTVLGATATVVGASPFATVGHTVVEEALLNLEVMTTSSWSTSDGGQTWTASAHSQRA